MSLWKAAIALAILPLLTVTAFRVLHFPIAL